MTKTDIQHCITKLLPPGKAWMVSLGNGLSNLVEGIAEEFYRIHQQVEQLITNFFPSTVQELLPEWETEYGLPNAVLDETSDIAIRRAQIQSLYTFDGVVIIPNKNYYINLALRLGYVVTNIDDSTTGYFECGVSCCGEYLGEGADNNVVLVYVNGPATGGARLERAFNWLKHTNVSFEFIYTE
jgi:uncharacterized protein YmfQ (DUF2313 family)